MLLSDGDREYIFVGTIYPETRFAVLEYYFFSANEEHYIISAKNEKIGWRMIIIKERLKVHKPTETIVDYELERWL